jgi:hypothetical protein
MRSRQTVEVVREAPENYLGCKQKLSQAVNDNLGLEDT